MASADLRFDIRTPREARSQWHQIGSPQVRRASFLPVHRIYVSDSCMSIGHWVFWLPHPSEPPHIRFLFVEHAFCYQLPPDLVLPLHPCRVANSSPHRASSGFAPYRSAPCWAHQNQGLRLNGRRPYFFVRNTRKESSQYRQQSAARKATDLSTETAPVSRGTRRARGKIPQRSAQHRNRIEIRRKPLRSVAATWNRASRR